MAEANADQTGRFTQVGVTHNFRNGIGLDLSLQHQEYRDGSVSNKSLATQIGLQLPLGANTSLGVQYRTNLSGSGALVCNDVLQFRLSRRFNVGRNRGGIQRTASERKLLGSIAGRVYDDRNNNRKWDAGELSVPNVAIALRDDLQHRSDQEGNYNFTDLSPNNYKVSLVSKTLPIEFSVLAANEILVPVAADKTSVVDFPAVRTGDIRGIVFLDENRNGVHEAGEKTVSNVIVQAEGSEVISFSNERGQFALCSLPPQRWKISLDTRMLDEEYETTGVPVLEIEVAPGGKVGDVMIGIAPAQREVVSSFQKSE